MLQPTSGKRSRYHSAGLRRYQTPRAPVILGRLLNSPRAIHIQLYFGNRCVKAAIDTGATCSFVNTECAEEIKSYTLVTRRPTLVILATGTEHEVTEVHTVKIKQGSTERELPLILLPEATDKIVLGMDFLHTMGTTLVCGNQSISLQTPPTQRRNEKYSTLKVADEQHAIQKFLQEEIPMFESLRGHTQLGVHTINMPDESPVKQRYTPRNPAMLAVINQEIDELLAKGCIEPSKSPHSSPIVLVKKKTGKWRLCIDFRQVNAKSIPDAYPLPRIQSILDRLRGAQYISTLDLKNGYWQVPMDEGSKPYTAFTVPGRGLFQWKVMPFGLHSAPATFQRILDQVIGPDLEPFAFAYLDDIIIIGKTFKEHRENLHKVFCRLREANLKINPEKCEFFKDKLRYLGHMVSREGIHTDPDKVAAIREMSPPKDVRGVRRCLGVASWYRRFVPDFADVVKPLTALLKKGKHFQWGSEQEAAFDKLRKLLTEAPVLACPDFTQPFTLQTDASDYGLGAVLTQQLDGNERVIAYASRHLNPAELNYSPTEKECLAIVWGIRKMRPYLEGYHFTVLTDHLALKWLNSIDNPTGRIARWALELQQYTFTVEYRRGKLNVVADALSRQPYERLQKVTTGSEQNCKWITRKKSEVQENPRKFPDYTLFEEHLYRHLPSKENSDGSSDWKLCVPSYQRQQVMAENHSAVTAGHLGIRKTINRVYCNYYWPGMIRDIAKFVRRCDSCQRYKPSQQLPAGEMFSRIAEAPGETICADFVGPLPRSKHGNNMLLVFIDKFTKWVELVPLRSATGQTLQKAFRERVLAKWGCPKRFICDNGTQFTCSKFQQFLNLMGVHQQFTAPYTPQENPTERANRTVKTIIAQTCANKHHLWDEHLPEISLAINTGKSESTNYTPAFLAHGRELRLPQSLFDQAILGNGRPEVDPEQHAQNLQEIFRIVRRNLQKAAQDQARQYNLRRRPWKPNIGDLVLTKHRVLSKGAEGFAAKLAPRFEGPYQVWNFTSPVIVVLRDPDNGRTRKAHISDLKTYHAPNQSQTEPPVALPVVNDTTSNEVVVRP